MTSFSLFRASEENEQIKAGFIKQLQGFLKTSTIPGDTSMYHVLYSLVHYMDAETNITIIKYDVLSILVNRLYNAPYRKKLDLLNNLPQFKNDNIFPSEDNRVRDNHYVNQLIEHKVISKNHSKNVNSFEKLYCTIDLTMLRKMLSVSPLQITPLSNKEYLKYETKGVYNTSSFCNDNYEHKCSKINK